MESSGIFTNLAIRDTNPEGLAAVVSGELKAFFVFEPSLIHMLSTGYPELRVVDSYEPSVVGTYGIAVRKDDPELLAAVNASLAKLAAEGTIRRILADWDL
jgi:polar amino acid transport system substrate-binding protein